MSEIPPPTVWQSLPPSVHAIHTHLAKVVPQLATRLHPDLPFSKCGGDSIDLVELLCVIEAEYGVRFQIDDLNPDQIVRELLMIVDKRATKRPGI